MKKLYFLFSGLLLLTANSFGQQSCYTNPSLEGPPVAHNVPAPWIQCYGSPDTQPGNWGITQAPSNGATYVSFLHSGQSPTGYNEGMTQLLSPCLQAGTTYSFTVDLAHTLTYNTASPNGCYSTLAVFGGNTQCAQAETLWTSGAFTHTNWQQYTVTFTPNGNWCYLSFSPYFVPNTPCGGGSGYINVMMDNISCVQPSGVVNPVDVSCFGTCDGMADVQPTNGTPPFSFSWTGPGAPYPNNDTITGLCPGNYSITITDAANATYTENFVINEPTQVTVNAGFTNPTCYQGVNGSANSVGQGGTGPLTYSWMPGNLSGQNISNLTSGTYTVTATDSNGCTATDQVTLVDPTQVTVNVNDTLVCVGQDGILTASANGGTGAYQIVWDNGAYIGNPYNTGPILGTFVHTVVAIDANGCISPVDQATVTPGQLLTILAGTDIQICNGETATLTAAANGGDGNYTFVWTPNNQVGVPLDVTPNVTTNYTVTVTDGCGTPPVNDNLLVTVHENPVVDIAANPRSGCTPICVNFTDNSVVAGGTITAWSWDLGNGNISASNNPASCYNTPGDYDIELTVTSNEGCTSTQLFPSYVSAYPLPVACFISDPNPTTINKPTVYFETSCTVTNNPSTYQWDFGNGNTATSMNAAFTYADTGSYPVTYIVTNSYGCSDTATGTVRVNPDFTLFIPNTFTPNADGLNDLFFAQGRAIKEFQMYIFDRWGEKLFYTNKMSSGWDGKVRSSDIDAKQDVYVYRIYVINDFGEEFNYVGRVQLIR